MVTEEQGMAEAADEQCRLRSQTRIEPDTRTVEDVRNNGLWRVFPTRDKETPTEGGKRSHRQKTDTKTEDYGTGRKEKKMEKHPKGEREDYKGSND